MHIRPLEPEDISTTASITASCFWDDELYNFSNPYKTQYPDDFRANFVRRIRLRHWSPGFVLYVAVTDDGDEGHVEGGRVAGYAVWYRIGKSMEAMKWHKQSLQSYVECTLLSLQDAYVAFASLDKSSCPTNLAKWLAVSQDPFASIPELWTLRNLCVSPDFQRRGVGAMLIAWGKDQAEKERCPVGLTSSTRGKGLYEKQGFRRYGTIKVEGFPVDDVPIFLWEPNEMEGRWGVRGDSTMRRL